MTSFDTIDYKETTVASHEVKAGYHVAVIGSEFFVKEYEKWAEYPGEPHIWFDNVEEAKEYYDALFV